MFKQEELVAIKEYFLIDTVLTTEDKKTKEEKTTVYSFENKKDILIELLKNVNTHSLAFYQAKNKNGFINKDSLELDENEYAFNEFYFDGTAGRSCYSSLINIYFEQFSWDNDSKNLIEHLILNTDVQQFFIENGYITQVSFNNAIKREFYIDTFDKKVLVPISNNNYHCISIKESWSKIKELKVASSTLLLKNNFEMEDEKLFIGDSITANGYLVAINNSVNVAKLFGGKGSAGRIFYPAVSYPTFKNNYYFEQYGVYSNQTIKSFENLIKDNILAIMQQKHITDTINYVVKKQLFEIGQKFYYLLSELKDKKTQHQKTIKLFSMDKTNVLLLEDFILSLSPFSKDVVFIDFNWFVKGFDSNIENDFLITEQTVNPFHKGDQSQIFIEIKAENCHLDTNISYNTLSLTAVHGLIHNLIERKTDLKVKDFAVSIHSIENRNPSKLNYDLKKETINDFSIRILPHSYTDDTEDNQLNPALIHELKGDVHFTVIVNLTEDFLKSEKLEIFNKISEKANKFAGGTIVSINVFNDKKVLPGWSYEKDNNGLDLKENLEKCFLNSAFLKNSKAKDEEKKRVYIGEGNHALILTGYHYLHKDSFETLQKDDVYNTFLGQSIYSKVLIKLFNKENEKMFWSAKSFQKKWLLK